MFYLIIILCSLTSVLIAKPVVQFTVQGVSDEIKSNVLARLEGKRDNYLSAPTKNALKYFIHEAPTIVYKAVAPYGYLDAKIKQSILHSGNHWHLSYQITPGQPTYIRTVHINISGAGAHAQVFQKVIQRHLPKVGSILNIKTYDNFVDHLYTVANQFGYFQATMIRKNIIVNKGKYSASIIIDYNTGDRSRFGMTYFNPTPIGIKLLRRYLNYHMGSPYREHKIQTLQQDLANSGYFNQVVVTPQIDKIHHNQIPVNIQLTMTPARKYSIGFGYGSDTGVRTTLGVTFRHLNSKGHKLSLETRYSKLSKAFSTEYIIPGRHPARNHYTINAGYAKQDLSIGNSDAKKIGISYTTIYHKWTQVIQLSYLKERYDIHSFVNTPKIDANMLVPMISWNRRIVDHSLKPSKGYLINLRLSGASKSLLSRSSFYQVYFETKWLRSFFHKKTRLILHGRLGYSNVKNLENLPLSLQLLAGGATSVRGYPYNSIGPGNILRVSTVELQQHLFRDFYIAGFYDAAMVGDRLTKGIVYQSAGPALVWISPIGSLEISAAKPFNKTSGKKKWGFNFSMGPTI